ncbi:MULTISPECIES: hypothetical protein [Bacillus cereus group]|uniref:DUF3961 domain-containing protein n=1 Tax=Bacillus cereus TaxID=1396 RepID=A0A9W7QK73_BACCE|nr:MULTISPECIES: hypothetical protein [Bacillus cereus group]KAB2400730.1 hypothetical protein F8172_00185 [Bacillus cereus]KAB2410944.1 hypothetical protein F8170_00200 [Bacillus cereus]KAB2431053.1 hypothetical protein F8168_05955 [Bacillus cereus]MDY7964939.1 hypothetical protein [Bacillus thuringiensis]MED3580348.1 hypothetical protein [Bacillus thuringiensis]
MANTLYKITNNELIVPQRKSKSEFFGMFRSFITKKYNAINEWFGIDGASSDRVWFYGTITLAIFLLSFAYLVSGFAFGF